MKELNKPKLLSYNLITPRDFYIFCSPSDEAAQIIAHCKERLMKANIISQPFTATEIQGGILKDYLQDEDYLAPHKVNIGG